MRVVSSARSKAPEILIAAILVCGGIFGWLLMTGDPFYRLQESWPGSGFRSYDELIHATATRYALEPELVKAVVWQESRFREDSIGNAGERGLMQVMEPAAGEWASSEKIETFRPTDLLDPKVNLEAGSWYLARALRRHAARPDPLPFALADYNAGASRTDRWIEAAGGDPTSEEFLAAIDFPMTLNYIENIIARRKFYILRREFDNYRSDIESY